MTVGKMRIETNQLHCTKCRTTEIRRFIFPNTAGDTDEKYMF